MTISGRMSCGRKLRWLKVIHTKYLFRVFLMKFSYNGLVGISTRGTHNIRTPPYLQHGKTDLKKRIHMNSNNISLSLELICLMNWLLKHEKQGLNTLIKQAIQHGFAKELEKIDTQNYTQIADDLYSTILDFLLHFEKVLLKNIETVQLDSATQNAILPALERIDIDSVDGKTLWLSMQQTKAKLGKNGQETVKPAELAEKQQDPKAIFFEQIIKNWKPTKDDLLN